MLARFHALLPFYLTVPEGIEFNLHPYEDSGYQVCVFPPGRSDRPAPLDSPEEFTINGTKGFRADVLRVDFWKEAFNRETGVLCDPPKEVIDHAVNSFLSRLRYVARAPQIRPLEFLSFTWRLQYLNDDESELEKQEGLVRGRGTLSFSFGWVALDPRVWDSVHGLPVDFEPPPWDDILLDASAELPSHGPAIVLAATALEVFISYVLGRLAERKNVPADLWKWINSRGDWLREPTVEEQFDFLLLFLSGHSLKEDEKLWEAFKNLKTARNSFVHEGVARVGGQPVSREIAGRLIAAARDIIAKIRAWLPEDLPWPEYRFEFQIEAVKKLT